jgi:hypothetical protein
VDDWLGYLDTLWLPFFLGEGTKEGALVLQSARLRRGVKTIFTGSLQRTTVDCSIGAAFKKEG